VKLPALVACVALLGAQNTAPVSAPAPPSVRPPALASVDDAFAIAVMQGNAAELQAARLALARTGSDDVAAFARQMITDHDTIATEGMLLVKRHLSRVPAPLGAPDVLALLHLANLPAVDFDQQYALTQIADHLATQTAFATEARDGKDPELQAFAAKWLPTITAHLELAVTLVKHVGGNTPFKN
jgi:putative membrane protein